MLVAAIVAVSVLRAPAEYQSQAVLVIDNPLALATAGDDGTINKLERLRSKYATLANTAAIAGPAGEQLGRPVGQVIGATDVIVTPAALSLVVIGRAGDSSGARELTEAMAAAIVEFVAQEHLDNNVPPVDRFAFRVVQPASPGFKTYPSRDRATTSALIAFAVVLGGAYVALQLFRPGPVVGRPESSD